MYKIIPVVLMLSVAQFATADDFTLAVKSVELLHWGDFVTTRVGLSIGLEEKSFIVRAFSTKPRLHFLLTVGSNVIIRKLSTDLYRKNKTLALGAMLTCIILKGIILYHNLKEIFR